MKKGDSGWGVMQIAGILLILLFLVTLIISLTNSYGGVKELIKKFLGEKTEAEVTREQNEMATKVFTSLKDQIKKCQNSKDSNCGCLVDLNKFSNYHKISFTDKETKLINIKNLEDSGIQMSSFDARLNCYWDNSLESKPLTEIFFEERPFIFKEVIIWTSITGRGYKYYFTNKFNLLKKDGKLCWLTNKVDESKVNTLKECQ